MTESLKQKIKEQMQVLPKESQEAINNFDWAKISEEIGRKYFLTEDDLHNFQIVIALTLLGLEEQDMLALNIEDELGTSKNYAEKMTDEVIQKILKPIVEKLEEKTKGTLRSRPVHWQQNLDFILSGGDYTAFIREPVEETKDEIPKTNDTFNPSKLDDLKSRFTI